MGRDSFSIYNNSVFAVTNSNTLTTYSPYSSAPVRQAGQPSILPPPHFLNTLPSAEEDTEPIKAWKLNQAEEIKERDKEDEKRRKEMANKAEKAIDQFYEEYNKTKERNIRENKQVLS